MIDPALARRFQEAAESIWKDRPVLATITAIKSCHGASVLVWEVELSDSCERIARHAVAEEADPDPARIAAGLRDALQMHAHLELRKQMWEMGRPV